MMLDYQTCTATCGLTKVTGMSKTRNLYGAPGFDSSVKFKDFNGGQGAGFSAHGLLKYRALQCQTQEIRVELFPSPSPTSAIPA